MWGQGEVLIAAMFVIFHPNPFAIRFAHRRTDYTLVVQGLKEDVEKLKSKKEAIEKEKEDAKDDTSSKAGIWRHAVQGLKNKVGKLVK